MNNETDNANASKTPAPSKHNSGAADLEKVTDYAEEKEIDDDGNNLNNAMNAISDKRKKETSLKAEKEKQLASVKVNKEEIDLIVNEFEISKQRAERVLKEQNGDLSSALSALINA